MKHANRQNIDKSGQEKIIIDLEMNTQAYLAFYRR